jgi:fatty acid desaturase
METIDDNHERQSVQAYARSLRPELPAYVFDKAPGRLFWLPAHLAVIAAAACIVLRGAPASLALLCAVIAGHSWGCLGLLAHETLHHAVTRRRWVESVVGCIGFAPYCLSPALWSVWHNQAHHGHTGKPVADPDGFGTLNFWR